MILSPFINNSEYVSTINLEWCKELRNHFQEIKQEYVNYTLKNNLKRFKEIDHNQEFLDIGDIPWEVLMLRVYNKDTNKIKHFPKTYDLIKKIPGCSFAMFSILPPGKKLLSHRGPSKSVLRYHLSLIVPDDISNCFINVNNIKHHWKEGDDVMFDDTFIHSAENNTNQTRVVLFLDIQRKFNNSFLDILNNSILHYAQFNYTVKNIVKNTNES
jgi:beta-hydroxylase